LRAVPNRPAPVRAAGAGAAAGGTRPAAPRSPGAAVGDRLRPLPIFLETSYGR